MGEVYRADDLKLKQPVALKFLPQQLSGDGAALARFYQEVSIARRISHRHVCRVYDIGEAQGMHFLSMEYVRGEELSSLLKRIGRLPEDKAVDIARQLCAGLAAIHENGVLHRDLKPANVMLDERGDIRIADFGIAALGESLRGRDALGGTPAYMAPEQLDGREVTQRSDLYALGLVLYEVFTGRRAFEADTLPDLLRLRRSDAAPTSPSSLVRNLDPAVERIIERCLQPEPRKRPASALEVAAALPGADPLAAALAAGETPSPEMVAASRGEGGLRPAASAALFATALASLALVVALSGELLVTRHVPLEKPPEVLAESAREAVRAAGYGEPAADAAYGFEIDAAYYLHVLNNDPSAARWDAAKRGRPALVYFWYRQSPRPFAPEISTQVTEVDPRPQVHSGMADVRLDTLGRLLELRVAPLEVDEPGAAAATPAPDWASLFAEAGLDMAAFAPVEPRWTPPVYADARAAWEGAYPGLEGVTLRIEAASYRGRPVSFHFVEPWREPHRTSLFETDPGLKRLLVFLFVVFVSVVTAGLWLARRNFRLGRGDRAGAFKLGLVGFATSLAASLVGASHVAAFQGEVWILFVATSRALFMGALLWLLYSALEPYVRRRAPHRLVSWTRLLAGRFRDPVVGRDVLVGALLGIWMNLSAWLGELAARALGVPPDLSGGRLETLLGVTGIAPVFLGQQPTIALAHGLAFPFLLFLLWLALRSERRAAVALWLLFVVAFSLAGLHAVQLTANVALGAAYVFVASRFGMLAIAVAQFTFFTIEFYPYTSDPTAWYAGVTLFSMTVVAGVAAYGFWTSLAGRRLFHAGLLED
jgi:serine/threonine-protein kinase